MEKFTENDIAQLQKKGLSKHDIEEQVENFKQGFPFTHLVRAATPGDGVRRLDHDDLDKFKKEYGASISENDVVKFVPASGAASRMFKFLFDYLEDNSSHKEEVEKFIGHLEHFAFHDDLKASLDNKGLSLENLRWRKDYESIIRELLEPDALNCAQLPKGLIKFHRYQYHSRTAVEEHLVEGANYGLNADYSVKIHFTVLPEHQVKFESHLESKKTDYENFFRVNFHTECSFQEASTDRVAVDLENRLFRNPDGSLLFRPGGHGALLNNLHKLHDDLIFIKNIDNVVPDKYKVTTYDYKKALAGLLLTCQDKVFGYLRELEDWQSLSGDQIEEMLRFLRNDLNVIPPESANLMNSSEAADYLFEKFNRPIRVCGMVKNQGEPGGGPFWVRNSDGSVSLQIVEKAQIDLNDPDQKAILDGSTHFNPVDLVCGVKDYQGRKFDLFRFRDLSAGLISHKSKEGKPLKAQELPGLWNGSMAGWNTVFVEVPLITFNPVKTVNDLLRDEHQ